MDAINTNGNVVQRRGVPGSGLGRTPGSLNHANRDLKAWLTKIFQSQEYRDKAYQRILAGTAPQLELYLLQMTYGKPRESLDLRISANEEDLTTLGVEELEDRAAALLDQLKQARETNAALPAEYRIEGMPQGAQDEVTSISEANSAAETQDESPCP